MSRKAHTEEQIVGVLRQVISPFSSSMQLRPIGVGSLIMVFMLLSGSLCAQKNPPTRLTGTINESRLTVLRGNTLPVVGENANRGAAFSALPLQRMLLVLRRTPEQETALHVLLNDQQDKSSPGYHQWLRPAQFGQEFGPSEQDIQTITSWLIARGFEVSGVAKGRGAIEFSGNAEQVKEAFHTEIHKYLVNGKEHWANASDPEIPITLAPIVAGIVSLHNFPRTPLHHVLGLLSQQQSTHRYQLITSESRRKPLFTAGMSCGLGKTSCYALGPSDFATIYDVLPLWNESTPIDGTGQTIAIVGQSDIYPQDVNDFRNIFGLPPAKLNIIHNGPDPGKLATEGDELESDLDVEWSGAIAKGATIDLVVSASTNTTAGVDLSAEYIVDNDLAPVMSESYSACEFDLGTAGNLFFNQLWEQAAAEGISVFVSAGDSGSAVCDQNSAPAIHGLSVSGISSTPYDVAVGGTDFNDLQDPTTYWNATNDPTTQASAKSYIPEMTWNDTCTNSEYLQFTGVSGIESDCNDSNSNFWPYFLIPVAGSGGASNCITPTGQSVSDCSGGYDKPSWQAGPGVPNDGKRDIPDVSLFAGDGLNSHSYVVCEFDIYGGCNGDPHNGVAVGGTSASAPTFAAIMALINQKTQSRQGDANYVLYPLAAQPGASCDSSGNSGSSCIFHDVSAGTIAMPCVGGSPDCTVSNPSDKTGVLSGYNAAAGYDLATGLGSVDAANLVNNWNSVSFQPTISTLSLSPTTQITHGSPVTLNITVAPKTGSGDPFGQVSLLTSKGEQVGLYTLTNGAISDTTSSLPGGSYTVSAHYAGDGTYAASNSSPGVAVTVNPEASTTTVQAFTLDQNGNATLFTGGPYGHSVIYLGASVAGKSGNGSPTGTVSLAQTLDGTTANLSGDPYPLNNQGYTMIPLPGGYYQAFAPGTYSFTAKYSGDGSFNASTSSQASFTVTKASTSTSFSIFPCTSQPGLCNIPPGTQVVMTASALSYDPGFVVLLPTGTMTFYSNGTQLGTPVTIEAGEVPPTIQFSTTQLPAGLNNISVQYSGDTNYAGSTSPMTSVDVGGTFSITANPNTIDIASPGQSGSTTLTFAAQNGFTGSTPLSSSTCSNLPPKSSCSFSPSTVTFTSSATTVPVTLTITTTGLITTFARVSTPGYEGLRIGELAGLFLVGICIVPFNVRRQIRYWNRMIAFIGLSLMLFLTSCGGGGATVATGGGGGGGTIPGTPAGNYQGITVMVNINGVMQLINNLTVNVQ